MAENSSNSSSRAPLQEISLMETSARTEYYRDETPRKILQTKYAESYSTKTFRLSRPFTPPHVQYDLGSENLFSPVSSKTTSYSSSPQRLMKLFTPKKVDSGNKQSTPIRSYCNPFELGLTDRLNTHSFSPSVFSKVLSPSQEDDSAWRIEHMALMKPAEFHLSPQLFLSKSDPAIEAQAQEAILQYFNQQHIAPSPWSYPKMKTLQKFKVHRSNSQPSSSRPSVANKPTKNAWTQTTLSLPPELPPEVEEVLARYLNHDKEEVGQSLCTETEDVSLNSSGLRRKLFLTSEKSTTVSTPVSASNSSKSDSPASTALSSSPINISPQALSPPLPYTRTLASPQLSPIGSRGCIYSSMNDLNQSATCSSSTDDEDEDEEAANELANVRERTLLMEEETAQSWINAHHDSPSFLDGFKLERQVSMETCDTGYFSSSASITQSRTGLDLPHTTTTAQIKFEKSQFFTMDT